VKTTAHFFSSTYRFRVCHAQQHIKSRTQTQITRCEYQHSVVVRCKRVGLINASVPFVAYSTHGANK